jgi:predicted RNA-binding Zn-ribbon protein involved in translation (DUF1610 family)
MAKSTIIPDLTAHLTVIGAGKSVRNVAIAQADSGFLNLAENGDGKTAIRRPHMERLHFTCPQTGQDVDVGIDSELETLLRIRSNHVVARCPVCGERHEWQVREARLLQAA